MKETFSLVSSLVGLRKETRLFNDSNYPEVWQALTVSRQLLAKNKQGSECDGDT